MEGQKLESILKTALRWSVIALCFAIVLTLPVMSAYAEGELVSGEILVRGLNLLTLSPFGVLVILFFLLSMWLSRASHIGKPRTSLWVLCSVATMVSFGCALFAAYHWLQENVAPQISWKYGLPILMIAVVFPTLFRGVSLSTKNFVEGKMEKRFQIIR